MDHLIARLVSEHDAVIIPKFGAFMASGKEDRLVLFNQHLRFNDGLVVNAWSAEKGISTEEALQQVEALADGWMARLNAGEELAMVGLGLFRKQGNEIRFERRAAQPTAPTAPDPLDDTPPQVPQATEAPLTPLETPSQASGPTLNEILAARQEEEAEQQEIIKQEAALLEQQKQAEAHAALKREEEERAEIARKEEEQARRQEEQRKQEAARLEQQKQAEDARHAAALQEKEKQAQQAEEAQQAEPAKKEPASQTAAKRPDPTMHIAPQVEGQDDAPVTPTRSKQKKKRPVIFWVMMVLILIVAAGATYTTLNYSHVKELLGITDEAKNTGEESDSPKKPAADDTQAEDDAIGGEATPSPGDTSAGEQADHQADEPAQETEEAEQAEEPAESATQPEADVTTTQSTTQPEPEPQPTPNPVPTTQASGSYHLIAGAFSSEANADRFVSELKGKGLNVEKFMRGTMYMVSAGKYASARDARAAMPTLGVETWVLKY